MKFAENKSIIIVTAMVVVWGVFIWLGLMLRPDAANPEAEILAQFETAQKALQNEDVVTLKKIANFEGIAGGIAGDIVDIPDAQSAMGAAIVDNVAASLLSEFESLMKEQEGQAPNPTTVLGQVYVSLVGSDPSKMHLKGVSVTDIIDTSALLTMTWAREDVSVTFPLSMDMAVENGLWTFKNIDGLEEAFSKINARQAEMRNAQNKKIMAALKESVVLDRAQISTAIATEENAAPRVMLFMAVKNMAGKDIKTYHSKVSVTDSKGQVLKAFDLSDTDGLSSGELSEKSWPIFLDIDDALEKQVLIQPAEALVVSLDVNEIVYEDGEVLAPLGSTKAQGE